MKKKFLLGIAIVLILIFAFLAGTGLQKRTDVMLFDYTILEDGSTFGDFNSSFGTVRSFVLELAPTDTEIYFNRPGDGYELVLQKDEITGQWVRP